MKLSIVTTLFGSEATVQAFHERVTRAATQIASEVEFIYVNDGSPDRSLEQALELRSCDPRIVVVDLARNFGHHPALMAGLKAASGDFVFLIDSDLEEPPELLIEFWRRLSDERGADAIYGVQVRRKGGIGERVIGRLWYAMFCRLTPAPYPANSLTARLMTRRYVDSVLLYSERDLDMMGVFALTGYEQIALPARKDSKSPSTYTLHRRLGIAATGLVSFTTAPLSLILAAGCLLVLGSVAAGAIMLVLSWTDHAGLSLAALAVWSIWMLGGLLLASVGVLGLYLGRVLQEVKARPRAIIRHIYRSEEV